MRRALPLLAAALLTACASIDAELPELSSQDVVRERLEVQRIAVAEALARDERVRRLAWPILTANAPLCRRTAPRVGIRLGDADTVTSAARGLTKKQVRALGYTGEAFILSVPPGSPADQAGIGTGTKVLRIGAGEAEIVTAEDFGEQMRVAMEAFEAGGSEGIAMIVEDEAASFETLVVPVEACDIAVVSSGAGEVNASATFTTISIYAGLVRALEGKDEALAFVIAHEIAHVAGRHPRKGVRNALATGAVAWAPPLLAASVLGDQLAYPLAKRLGAKAPPLSTLTMRAVTSALGTTDFEREADYLGLYMLARAGYDVEEATGIFQLFANINPRSTWLEVTHPVVPERNLRLRLAAEEIAAKKARGEELVPEGWEVSRNARTE